MAASGETLPEPSGPGSVVLDIGGDIGAAIIYTAPSLAGREIEIRPVGGEWDGTHVAVRERLLRSGSKWAALFPQLQHGSWEVRVRFAPDSPVHPVSVEGAKVSSTTYPDVEVIVSDEEGHIHPHPHPHPH